MYSDMFSDHNRPSTRVLLSCGVAAPVLFLLVFHLDAVTRPGYDLWRHGPSLLMLGDRGWVQVVNFVAAGVVMIGCAVALRRVGRGSRWDWLPMAVFGVGVVGAALFRTDPEEGYPPGTPSGRLPGWNYPASWQTDVHTLSVVVLYAAATAASFVYARRFAGEPGGRPWAAALIATGVAAPLVLGTGLVISGDPDLVAFDGVLGRLIIPLGWVWAVLVPLRLRTGNSVSP